MSTFAKRLRELRLRKGFSLQQLADAVGVSKAHVWDLESSNSKNPSMELLKAFADKLGTTVFELVGETNKEFENDPPELAPLFRNLRELNSKDLKTIQRLTEDLMDRDKDDTKD